MAEPELIRPAFGFDGMVAAWLDPPAAPAQYPQEAALVAAAVARRQRQFYAGRACARAALAALGVAPAPLLRTAIGAPAWPDGVVGSLAHCERAALAVVAPQARWRVLGIDIEPDQPLPDDVAEFALTPGERAQLAAMPQDAARMALVHFSAKECVHKCVHPLRDAFLEFDEVEIYVDARAGHWQPIARSARAVTALAGMQWFGWTGLRAGCRVTVLAGS